MWYLKKNRFANATLHNLLRRLKIFSLEIFQFHFTTNNVSECYTLCLRLSFGVFNGPYYRKREKKTKNLKSFLTLHHPANIVFKCTLTCNKRKRTLVQLYKIIEYTSNYRIVRTLNYNRENRRCVLKNSSFAIILERLAIILKFLSFVFTIIFHFYSARYMRAMEELWVKIKRKY